MGAPPRQFSAPPPPPPRDGPVVLKTAASASGSGGIYVEEVVEVPRELIGALIGRGGEKIKAIQATSGCRVVVSQVGRKSLGQTHALLFES